MKVAEKVDKTDWPGQFRLAAALEASNDEVSNLGSHRPQRYQRREYAVKDVPTESNKTLPIVAIQSVTIIMEVNVEGRQLFELAETTKCLLYNVTHLELDVALIAASL